MKKFLYSFAAVTAFLFLAGSLSAQTPQAQIAQVRAAAIHCAQPHMAPFAQIVVVEAGGTPCFVSGVTLRYEVYVFYGCRPDIRELCDPLPPRLVAIVTTDCEGNVFGVTCQ